MADHYNMYHLKHVAGTIAACMELSLPEAYAPGIDWVVDILKARLGGAADRVVMYHADAVGLYMWQKYTNIFAPVYAHTQLALPYVSTIESVTPVAHASMYTGLMPEEHGIQTYVRPDLQCSTLYDVLIAAGKKPAIAALGDSTFTHIFTGRDMPIIPENTGIETINRGIELAVSDEYDLVSIHTSSYDSAAHAYGPESKEALNALCMEAEGFERLAVALQKNRGKHRTLLVYAPDHGQHPVAGGRGSHGSMMIEDMNVLHFFGVIV